MPLPRLAKRPDSPPGSSPRRSGAALLAIVPILSAPPECLATDAVITPIHLVQGRVPAPAVNRHRRASDHADNSPLLGRIVTIEGVVTGWDDKAGQSNAGRIHHNERGLFVQEEEDDYDDRSLTSEGLFVQFSSASDEVNDYPIGSVVRVRGKVVEHFELTAIAAERIRIVGTAELPAPVTIAEELASRDYYEALEGMRVVLRRGVANSGATNRFGELFLVPGNRRRRVFGNSHVPGLLALSDDAGAGNPPIPRRPSVPSLTLVSADLFDRIENATGPLAYSYGEYKLVVQGGLDGSRAPEVVHARSGEDARRISFQLPTQRPRSDLVRVVSMNVRNFFPTGTMHDGAPVSPREYAAKRDRIAHVLERLLLRPEIAALQEIHDLKILTDLAASLSGYRAFLAEGNDSRGIDVGFLVAAGDVTVHGIRQYGRERRDATGLGCGDRSGLLFDRPPLALDAEKGTLRFTVIANHFSSRSAPDACRVAQAEFVAALTNSLAEEGRHVIIAGDLNAHEDEPPLRILTGAEGKVTDLRYKTPENEAYSAHFRGRLVTLDYILVSKGLLERVEDFRYLHVATDYHAPPTANGNGHGIGFALSSSLDHDPALLTLRVD